MRTLINVLVSRFALRIGLFLAFLMPIVGQAVQLAPHVYGELYKPESGKAAPAVIVLHGVSGIYPEWTQYAEMLSRNGYVALMLDYYAETGPAPRRELRLQYWPAWMETISAAIKYLQGIPSVSPDQVGVVGFSLGGFLAVHAAGTTPDIRAAVVYYGGGTSTLEKYAPQLPPILILHGERDNIVPVDKGIELYETINQLGKVVEIKTYPGVGHCFNCGITNPSSFDASTAADAEQEALNFLSTHLQ